MSRLVVSDDAAQRLGGAVPSPAGAFLLAVIALPSLFWLVMLKRTTVSTAPEEWLMTTVVPRVHEWVQTNLPPLEVGGLPGLDPHVGKVAEAGGDAIHGRAFRDEALDHGSAGAHALGGPGIERDRPPAARDLDHVVDGEIPAGDRKGRHRSLYYAPCDGCRTP